MVHHVTFVAVYGVVRMLLAPLHELGVNVRHLEVHAPMRDFTHRTVRIVENDFKKCKASIRRVFNSSEIFVVGKR